jgi:hypothetical protein
MRRRPEKKDSPIEVTGVIVPTGPPCKREPFYLVNEQSEPVDYQACKRKRKLPKLLYCRFTEFMEDPPPDFAHKWMDLMRNFYQNRGNVWAAFDALSFYEEHIESMPRLSLPRAIVRAAKQDMNLVIHGETRTQMGNARLIRQFEKFLKDRARSTAVWLAQNEGYYYNPAFGRAADLLADTPARGEVSTMRAAYREMKRLKRAKPAESYMSMYTSQLAPHLMLRFTFDKKY